MANYGHMLMRCVWQGESQMFEVPIHPDLETFAVDMSHLCGSQIYGFSYIDEEGDPIPARDDGDYRAMVGLYEWMQNDPTTAGPITIQLELEEPRPARNKLGLTVDIGGPAVDHDDGAAAVEGFGQVFDALGGGEILESDLEFGCVLGSGSGGTVYSTLHKPSQMAMAVKVIPIDASAEMQRHILAELEILHRCDSPHIIRYFGSFFNENRIMLCTEFMDGPSLEQIKCMPEAMIGRVIVAVLQGLVYLQEMKIMHRDIKPSNILVNSEGAIKLCDFGVSTQLQQSMTATFVGTNAYMAPERVQGKPYTVRSEVWSLGVTLVELAIGRFPYPADSESGPRAMLPIELLQCIVHEPPPRLSEDSYSPEFCDFTARCLNPVAEERPTPAEIMQHPLVEHYSQFVVGEDPEFAEWIRATLHRMRSEVDAAAVAAAKASSPVPGSFPPGGFA
eukprot:m.124164 g.124164  ORF g.124164 m.124164 type:complete len:448 (-) comp22065_c0_seq1:1099-2442(-)